MSNNMHYRLGDVCRVINGKAYKQEELLNFGKYRVLRVGNFFSNGNWYYSDIELDDDKYCENGDLLFAWSASFGPKIWNEEKTIYHYHIWKLVENEQKLNRIFLYYYLKNITQSMLGSTHGSIMLHLTKAYMEDLVINVPKDVNEQKRIASILSVIDTKIELNNKINAELEAMAKTIYDYWFVQFDFPNAKGKPYKTSGGKMVWNEELKREIPEGWKNGELKDIADLIRGVTYSKDHIKSETAKGVIPILRATNISGNIIDLNNMVYVPSEIIDEKQILNKYDILFVMSSGSIDHIGKNGFYYFEEKTAFGAFCSKLVAKRNYRYYLYSYTQSDFLFQTIKNECLGTNINNLNGSLVNGFKVAIPDNHVIDKFNDIVAPIYNKIAINQKENQQLASLRDWLLPMLMNGQVKVKDAEKMVEEKLSIAAEGKVVYKKIK